MQPVGQSLRESFKLCDGRAPGDWCYLVFGCHPYLLGNRFKHKPLDRHWC
jgi:hypothetical protein